MGVRDEPDETSAKSPEAYGDIYKSPEAYGDICKSPEAYGDIC